ncbi:hypothetical protein G4B88_008328 [Cannabis sativa]|uniref:Retrotransposon gag domain-containing protein n=1 Tax=Cannabis sativa TaxID=3483 RepID=A0A7J6G7M3_CANSA|nr:hypothetical protein G4B88_008328 [Cannabis sativa]
MPTRTKYDGTTDPLVHISDFNTLMQAHQVIRNLKCVLFLATLSGATFSWFKKFKRHSIVSWQQLSNAFKKEFQAARTHKLKCSSLANMRQFLGESLKAYINFFNIEATKTHGINDSARLMALVVGIAHGRIMVSTRWFDQILQKCSKDKYAEVVMLCWGLWKAQNELVWNQKYATVDVIFISYVICLVQWKSAQNRVARDSKGELEMAKSNIFAGIGALDLAEARVVQKISSLSGPHEITAHTPDSSPVTTATPLVSTGPPSEGDSGKEQDQAAHIQ